MKKLSALIFAVIVTIAGNSQAIEAGTAAPDFKATDINGKAQSVSQYKGKVVVLEWTNPDCPFVKKFYNVGAMQNFQKEVKADGAVWLSINSGAAGKEGHLTAETAQKVVADAKSNTDAYILDESGTIGKSYGAASTPTVVVIGKDGKVVYFGAVDDKPTFKSEDIATARNYLLEAVKAAEAGKAPEVANTKAYGCGVKYAD